MIFRFSFTLTCSSWVIAVSVWAPTEVVSRRAARPEMFENSEV
jgi:hypothetical protein